MNNLPEIENKSNILMRKGDQTRHQMTKGLNLKNPKVMLIEPIYIQ